MNPQAYRLPEHVRPRRYDIRLEAHVASDDFRGDVAIHMDIAESHNSIDLHARDLQLSDATLIAGGQSLVGTIDLNPASETATIRFVQPLPTGEATLRLAFQGKLNAGLRGLYRAVDGQEQLICTQCESTDARAIFPCFDEPTFKAQFAYEITTSAGATVLANSPLVSVAEREDGRKTWSFAPTKPMSTYLIALVIGDIAGTEAELIRGTPIRVWALAGKERMGAFAHRYTARLLPWYEDYFGVPYHFEKYDQVAVPGFAGGRWKIAG